MPPPPPNGKVFAQRAGAITSALEGVADAVFVSAPNVVEPVVRLGSSAASGRLLSGMPGSERWPPACTDVGAAPPRAASGDCHVARLSDKHGQALASSAPRRRLVCGAGPQLADHHAEEHACGSRAVRPGPDQRAPSSTFAATGNGRTRSLRGLHLAVEFGGDLAEGYRAWFLQRAAPEAEEAAYARSLELLHNTNRRKGPFAGVLGFSQGATMAGLMCTAAVSASLDIRPLVSVLCSGRVSQAPHLQPAYRSGLLHGVRSLHVIGLQDQVVFPEHSLELFGYFQEASRGLTKKVEHDGGHTLPFRKDIVDWLHDSLGGC
eukprot:SM000008S22155  [mRNA]  locus=s8:137623:139349:+ [translate_table: standard]